MIRFGVQTVSVKTRVATGTGGGPSYGRCVLRIPRDAHRLGYTIEVGKMLGDGETSRFRALFVKPFEVLPCA